MQAASSLACARRGWVNVDVDKIVCESCGATLKYVAPDSWTPTEGKICCNLDCNHVFSLVIQII